MLCVASKFWHYVMLFDHLQSHIWHVAGGDFWEADHSFDYFVFCNILVRYKTNEVIDPSECRIDIFHDMETFFHITVPLWGDQWILLTKSQGPVSI